MTKISEVITRLEQIVEWAIEHQSPFGYFAAAYLKMTLAVRDGVNNGMFENGSRMEQLVVRLAGRYFEAFDGWQAGQPCTKSWQTAFEVADNESYAVIQHIFLGLNAHINLDLAIVAAQTRSGDAIFGLRKDFDRINDIISAITGRMQEYIADLWLPSGLLGYSLRTEDEGWVHFSTGVARSAAWKAATALAFARQSETEKALIRDLDTASAFFARKITAPGFWINTGLRIMRRSERGSVSEKIETLTRI